MTTSEMVETMKSEGHYFAAGALQASRGNPCDYGCHFGMRSSRAAAVLEFQRGWKSYHEGKRA